MRAMNPDLAYRPSILRSRLSQLLDPIATEESVQQLVRRVSVPSRGDGPKQFVWGFRHPVHTPSRRRPVSEESPCLESSMRSAVGFDRTCEPAVLYDDLPGPNLEFVALVRPAIARAAHRVPVAKRDDQRRIILGATEHDLLPGDLHETRLRERWRSHVTPVPVLGLMGELSDHSHRPLRSELQHDAVGRVRHRNQGLCRRKSRARSRLAMDTSLKMLAPRRKGNVRLRHGARLVGRGIDALPAIVVHDRIPVWILRARRHRSHSPSRRQICRRQPRRVRRGLPALWRLWRAATAGCASTAAASPRQPPRARRCRGPDPLRRSGVSQFC
jgi:hypothetical protein